MPPKGLHRFTREIQITVDHDRSFSSDDANALWNHDGEEERGSDVTCLAHPRKNILANRWAEHPLFNRLVDAKSFRFDPSQPSPSATPLLMPTEPASWPRRLFAKGDLRKSNWRVKT